MGIRAGPAAYSGRAGELSPAGNAVAPRRPEQSIFCAPTPSSPPDDRLPVSSDPTASRVNEWLAKVVRSADYATFGAAAGIEGAYSLVGLDWCGLDQCLL